MNRRALLGISGLALAAAGCNEARRVASPMPEHLPGVTADPHPEGTRPLKRVVRGTNREMSVPTPAGGRSA
jgi:hypothetical protein